MKRQEIEQQIRLIKRTCKGPLLLPAEDRERLWHMTRNLIAMGDYSRATEFKNVLETTIASEGKSNFSDGNWDRLIHRIGELIDARIPKSNERGDRVDSCGYDFNETVLTHPFDGQMRNYKCPQCGIEGTFQSPIYEVEDN